MVQQKLLEEKLEKTVNCLLHKDLSFISRTDIKMHGVVACVCHPSNVEAEIAGFLEFTDQPS